MNRREAADPMTADGPNRRTTRPTSKDRDASPPLERSVERARQAHGKTRHPAGEQILVSRLDHHMNVVGLHRELNDPKPDPRRLDSARRKTNNNASSRMLGRRSARRRVT